MNRQRLLLVLLLLLAAWGGLSWWQSRPLQHPPGVLVTDAPRQLPLDGPLSLPDDDAYRLVDARRGNGFVWRTSLTRDDTGAGACELVYVEQLSIAPH